MPRITEVTIIHGYGVTPEKMWFPWIRSELENRGVVVKIPRLPNPFNPNFQKWMSVLTPIARTWTPQTLVIAHSLGGALAVRLLEKVARKRVAGVILVAPLFSSTFIVDPLVQFFARPIDWSSVRASSKNFHIIQAKDDPLVPCDHAFRYTEMLDAKLTLLKTGGHLTKKTCPPLLKIIESFSRSQG